jgi:hypothetical protein
MGEAKTEAGDENEAADEAGASDPAPVEGEQVSLGARRLEVDFLAYEACRTVADAIARKCVAVTDGAPIFVAPSGIASLLMNGRSLAASLDALKTMLLSVAAAAAAASAKAKAEAEAQAVPTTSAGNAEADATALEAERRTVEQRVGAAAAGLVSSLTGLGPIIDAANVVLAGTVKIAKALSVSETHAARETAIDDDLAATVVAAVLQEHGAQPRLLSTYSSFGAARQLKILQEISAATAELRAVAPSQIDEKAAVLLARVDELVIGTTAAPAAILPLAMLQMIESVEGNLLTVKTASAGGAYRVRRSLLSWLGFKDPLSARGGAALAWALTDLRSGVMLAGDLSFEISDPVQSSGTVHRRAIRSLPVVGDVKAIPTGQVPLLSPPEAGQAGDSA